MALVSITNVEILDNPAPFLNPFQFEITFECVGELADDLEWKVVYVGSAESEEYDQVLDSLLVGPIPIGVNKFVLQVDPPVVEKIPPNDLLGVTVVLLTCSYMGKEFVRVGYYVNCDYQDEELRENPPEKPIIEKIQKNILADKPRVTRFPINWDNQEEPAMETSTESDDHQQS